MVRPRDVSPPLLFYSTITICGVPCTRNNSNTCPTEKRNISVYIAMTKCVFESSMCIDRIKTNIESLKVIKTLPLSVSGTLVIELRVTDRRRSFDPEGRHFFAYAINFDPSANVFQSERIHSFNSKKYSHMSQCF